jgi:hypothetical protein
MRDLSMKNYYEFKIGDMVQYQGFLAIVVDIPHPDVLELEWINLPSHLDYDDFAPSMMFKLAY